MPARTSGRVARAVTDQSARAWKPVSWPRVAPHRPASARGIGEPQRSAGVVARHGQRRSGNAGAMQLSPVRTGDPFSGMCAPQGIGNYEQPMRPATTTNAQPVRHLLIQTRALVVGALPVTHGNAPSTSRPPIRRSDPATGSVGRSARSPAACGNWPEQRYQRHHRSHLGFLISPRTALHQYARPPLTARTSRMPTADQEDTPPGLRPLSPLKAHRAASRCTSPGPMRAGWR
jgi:hypothetical protein